ncbi:unnamed protein product [Gongylonema pulchrum]|uniref:G_PROTEIN_RECEP_F1_2 domain-containing protein n=1 Tax=Gongylonema pulchrum TaxID=637853 RepID=A0A183CVS6_9BILA|nr:unnamed protein product [Gongylonema pulchrum]
MLEETVVENNHDQILYCQHSHELTFSPLQAVSRIYVIPVICAFGTLGNTVNICVFTHKQVSISDLVMFLATFFVFSVPVIAEQSEDISLINISPPLLVFFYPIAHVAHTCAVYMTILVSVHRYLGICHPFLVRRSGHSRSVRLAITSAVSFSLLFNLPRCFELQSVPCQSETFHW